MITALALLLAAQAGAAQVQTLPGGTEVIEWSAATDGWSEVRLALTVDADPPDRAGLGAVATELLKARLRRSTRVGPSLRVERHPHGLVIGFATPAEKLQDALQSALQTALHPKITPNELRMATEAAAKARRAMLESPDALVELELSRALLGRAPPEGEFVGIAKVSEAELSAFLRTSFTKSNLRFIVTGAVPDEVPSDWFSAVPATTSSTAPAAPPPRRDSPLEIVVIDRPGLTRASLKLGWRPLEGRSEAVYTAAAARLGRGGRWQAPLMTIASSAEVGEEAAALKAMLQTLADASAQEPSDARWLRAVGTATRAVALSLRDAPTAADSLALDRIEPSRTLRPVLLSALAALRSPPRGVAPLLRAKRPVAVIVTSVRAHLPARLHSLAEGVEVRVVAWDQR